MRSRRAGALALAVALVGGLSLALWTGPSEAAASQIQVGVWSQSGGTTAPPTFPAGGLWVSSNQAVGPTAISAVRIIVDASDTAPQMTLHIANLTAPPGSAVTPSSVQVFACTVTGQWTATDPSSPGPWTSAPTFDCSKGQSAGVASADGSTLVFDLRQFENSSGVVEAVFVPGQIPSPASGATGAVSAVAPAPVPSGVLSGAPPPPAPAPAPADPTATTAWPTFDATFNPPATADIDVLSSPPTTEAEVTAPAYSTDTATVPDYSEPVSSVMPESNYSLPAASSDVNVGTPSPAAAAPRFVPPRVRDIAAAIADPTSKTVRIITGLVFVALCVWSWQLLSGSSTVPSGPSGGLLSLYDMPERGPIGSTRRRRFGTGERAGKPPSLR